MTSTMSSSSSHHHGAFAASAAPRAAMTSNQPPGTFLPNTKIAVGSHKVYIEKYLSEGGFAHVYVVRIPRDNNKHELAVLKRVAVPDKEHLANMRTEVETMKKLKGHRHIVTYIDSHASQLQGGGYEVFLLMEYCAGGGLIDFMNTRLQHRLTEPEILKIFGDCAEGVACMHYLKPPLLHRDLKVENVLIGKSASGSPTYKICDFGSTAPPRPAAKTVEEGRLIEEDIQKHTTMQYRSPEMIDVWRKQPIDEKADIWALGVLLYKLCYYTTPFEDVGQMAILNASYKYPAYPTFSDRLKQVIAWMLKEDPRNRPNIYQVVKEICSMRGVDVPIKDIYADRTQSEARRNETLPSVENVTSNPVGLQKTTPQVQVQSVPDITPMRRGRLPASSVQSANASAKPSPSPARGDPFAALDSKSYDVRAGAVDELSKRFPSLNEFAIAHDGGKFSFPTSTPASPPSGHQDTQGNLNERVANALADEVFASKSPPPSTAATKPRALNSNKTRPPSPTRVHAVASARETKPVMSQSTTTRPQNIYKSTATGTSPPPRAAKLVPQVSNRPIWRVPDKPQMESPPVPSKAAQDAASLLQPSLPPSQRPALLDFHRSKSHTATLTVEHATSSSRPSLEGGRPSAHDADDSNISRARSLNAKSRPTSMYVSSNMDYLRDQEQSRKRPSLDSRRQHSRQASQSRDPAQEENAIEDDMDYLRKTEESDADKRKSMKEALKIHSSHHRKRSSFEAVRSGAKNMLSGRFGDAFKRFEQNGPGDNDESALDPLTPAAREHDDEPQLLSPIIGSEATPSRHSDAESNLDEAEELPADIKREMERTRLSAEEKRVAEAAAEYRARVTAQGTGSALPTRASTIQKRVQSLLDEGRHSPVPKKTAEGYGRYTNSSEPVAQPPAQVNLPQPSDNRPAVIARKPQIELKSNNPYPRTRQQPTEQPSPVALSHASTAPAAAMTEPLQRVSSRPGPSAPPKPKSLRTGGPAQWPPLQPPADFGKSSPAKPSGLAALLAKDLEGVPDYPPAGSANPATDAPHPQHVSQEDGSLDDFSKRFPSLSGIEMVETEIDGRRA